MFPHLALNSSKVYCVGFLETWQQIIWKNLDGHSISVSRQLIPLCRKSYLLNLISLWKRCACIWHKHATAWAESKPHVQLLNWSNRKFRPIKSQLNRCSCILRVGAGVEANVWDKRRKEKAVYAGKSTKVQIRWTQTKKHKKMKMRLVMHKKSMGDGWTGKAKRRYTGGDNQGGQWGQETGRKAQNRCKTPQSHKPWHDAEYCSDGIIHGYL